MAGNYSLGTAWVDIKARGGKEFQSAVKRTAKGIKGAVRPAHTITAAATGKQGLAGLGAFLGPGGAAGGAIIDAAMQTAQKIGGLIYSLAASANPYAAKQFDTAVKDLWATIGQSFVPILQLGTQVVRLFADVMAGIMPYITDFVKLLIEPLKAFLLWIRGWLPHGSSWGASQNNAVSFSDVAAAKNQYATQALEAGANNSDPAKTTATGVQGLLIAVQAILAIMQLAPWAQGSPSGVVAGVYSKAIFGR